MPRAQPSSAYSCRLNPCDASHKNSRHLICLVAVAGALSISCVPAGSELSSNPKGKLNVTDRAPVTPANAGTVQGGSPDGGTLEGGSPDGGTLEGEAPDGGTGIPPGVEGPPLSTERLHPLGTNLAAASYWTRNFPFVDQMKSASRWISGNGSVWDDYQTLDLDSRGWVRSLAPGQIAHVILLGAESMHPSGTITVLYEGKGQLEYRGGVSDLQRSAGRDQFLLASGGGLIMNILSVDASDPLREIRVLLPGGRCSQDLGRACQMGSDCECIAFEDNYRELPFHPTFLRDIQAFSVLRFMDWQETNRERFKVDGTQEPLPVRTWDELPREDDAFWHPVPVSIMARLSNVMEADPWFNMPHQADDDFVARFAQEVDTLLDPARTAYVEYSNEAWNDIFDQTQWMGAQGCALWSSNPSECDANGDGQLCEYTAWNDVQVQCMRYRNRYFGQRTVEIGAIWGQHLRGPKLVRVLASQIGGAGWWIPQILEVDVNGVAVKDAIDAVATAPYFGNGEDYWQSRERFFDKNPNSFSSFGVSIEAGSYVALTGTPQAQYEAVFHRIKKDREALTEVAPALRYIAYEGGQHLVHRDQSQMSLRLDANKDPRMGEMYSQYLNYWQILSGDELFVHFSSPSIYGQYGAWGSKEYQGQPIEQAPKHRALEAYVYENSSL